MVKKYVGTPATQIDRVTREEGRFAYIVNKIEKNL